MRTPITDVATLSRLSSFGSCLFFDFAGKMDPRFWNGDWGILLNPSDPDVRQASIDGYAREWMKTGPEHHEAVTEGARRSGLGDANRLMNEIMAGMVFDFRGFNHGFGVADLGCGPGGSSAAFLDRFVSHVGRLVLVDPAKTVFAAKERFQCHEALCEGVYNIIPVQSLLEDWLPGADLSGIDVVLMGAAAHHTDKGMVFSTLRKKLRSGALIAVAEWCHCMLKSPAHFRVLVQVLDALLEPGILVNFDAAFPTTNEEKAAVLSEPPSELAALLSMAGGFWPNHALACKEKGINPMFSPFEGHMPVKDWREVFLHHGFIIRGEQSTNKLNPLNTVFLLENP